MRKFILLCLLVFTVSSVVFAQQMTDEQVILYVQEAQSQGKTQQEMLVELMKKGVTKEQIQRIQSKYSGKSDGSSEENANFMGEANSRLRTQKTYENKNKNISQDESGLDNLGSQKQSIKGLRAKSAQQRNGYGTGVNNSGQPGYGYNGPKSAEDAFTQQIFGHRRKKRSCFKPSMPPRNGRPLSGSEPPNGILWKRLKPIRKRTGNGIGSLRSSRPRNLNRKPKRHRLFPWSQLLPEEYGSR